MSNQQEIDSQLELLEAHRQTLSVYLKQLAIHGGEGNLPPAVMNGIQDARTNIRNIKKNLRDWGVKVADHPNDEGSSFTPPPTPLSGNSKDSNALDMYLFAESNWLAKLIMGIGWTMPIGVPMILIAFSLWLIFRTGPSPSTENAIVITGTLTCLGFIGGSILGVVLVAIGRFIAYMDVHRKRKRAFYPQKPSYRVGTIILTSVLLGVIIGAVYYLFPLNRIIDCLQDLQHCDIVSSSTPIPPTRKSFEIEMQVIAIPDSGRANCRQYPDPNATIITKIEKDEISIIVDGPFNVYDEGKPPIWWKVKNKDQKECWVAEFLLSPAN